MFEDIDLTYARSGGKRARDDSEVEKEKGRRSRVEKLPFLRGVRLALLVTSINYSSGGKQWEFLAKKRRTPHLT